MNEIDTQEFASGLAALLELHDPAKSDLSNRAEGTMQAIRLFAENCTIPTTAVKKLNDAVVNVCKTYKQTETIGRGDSAQHWPTNRFALQALAALGIKKPVLNAA